MKHLQPILQFLVGTYAKFGTSANLVREITVSVLTAVAVAVLVQLLTPAAPSPISEVRELMALTLAAQRRADSTTAAVGLWAKQRTIDSLTHQLFLRDEQDSLRANAGRSELDAMRAINGAIAADRNRTRH